MNTTTRFTLSSCLIPIAIMVLFTLQLAIKGDKSTSSMNYLMQIKGVNHETWQHTEHANISESDQTIIASRGPTGP
ncbi:hypothetical protein [Photobacterium sp. 1_MG-2023]|uniref:hypothetical protein n=1 Tax=Photobacterium sp. 1_MG-2023 TaxID=3062646 RepID=UPI0026E411B6|nr:hypothetical protein [Photobacterium sp. 1_MG-2023]MDO6706694.1 hypothetical protein [Photobacterium sp. 1_MG-2023]